MKKLVLLVAVVAMTALGCEGPQGPQGATGAPGFSAEAEVFELANVNFSADNGGFSIYRTLTPPILASDVILIYRLAGTIDASTPIWQSIPRTLYLPQGELDYDFDFSMEDFTIYAGGDFDISLTPTYLTNQTFRIVIIPGYFSRGGASVDHSNYDEVIEFYGLDGTNIKQLN